MLLKKPLQCGLAYRDDVSWCPHRCLRMIVKKDGGLWVETGKSHQPTEIVEPSNLSLGMTDPSCQERRTTPDEVIEVPQPHTSEGISQAL